VVFDRWEPRLMVSGDFLSEGTWVSKVRGAHPSKTAKGGAALAVMVQGGPAPLKPKDGLKGPPSYFLVSFTRAKEVSLPASSLSMSQFQVLSVLL
jgi:hypothetical protein